MMILSLTTGTWDEIFFSSIYILIDIIFCQETKYLLMITQNFFNSTNTTKIDFNFILEGKI